MSGFAHDVAGGNGNLVITSVQSPGYVEGATGWQIRKDGSAEFNNLTIRGQFNGTDFEITQAGLFLYDGTPGLGNLIGSWTSSPGVDDHGNGYDPGLILGESTSAQIQLVPAGLSSTGATMLQFPQN